MIRNVYLSPVAVRKLEEIFEYLENSWPAKVKTDFIEKLDRSKKILSKYPDSFPESKAKPGLFRCVVTKRNTLYYRIIKNEIEIVPIFDTRQHPKKLKKNLK